MTSTLESLISQLGSEQPYRALSEDQIRTQAKNRYQSVYDQKRLDAKQSYESSDTALARELSGLQKTYDSQRTSTAMQTRDSYSQTDRHALSRGMQRSSYNEANLTNVRLSGDAAQREIDREQAEHEAQIGEKRTQLSTQLAQTLKQLNADQQKDELAYADELTQREYQRAADSRKDYRQLAVQLYEYRHQLEQEEAEQARWQAEFNAKYGQSQSASTRKRTSSAGAAAVVASPAASAGVRRNQRDMMI